MPPQNQGEQYFVQTSNIGQNQDTFIFWFNSGSKTFTFVFTADHAKQVMRLLEMNIKKYEEMFGPLIGRLPSESSPSPINRDELL